VTIYREVSTFREPQPAGRSVVSISPIASTGGILAIPIGVPLPFAAGVDQEATVQRISEIIGKTVVSSETGNKVGSIADGLVDDRPGRVCAFVVRTGTFAQEHVLPVEEVRSLGGDTVLARSDGGLLTAGEWHQRRSVAIRSSRIKGTPVLTFGGEQVGIISDLMLDDGGGTLDGLEIAAPDFGGLITRRSTIPIPSDLRIGPDAIVIPEAAAAQLRAVGGDIDGVDRPTAS
jgi:uncharacterized protein YrrD